jgi:HEAT repeat protein
MFLGMVGLLLGNCYCSTLPNSAQAGEPKQPAKVELKVLLADLKSKDEQTKLNAIMNLADWGPKADAAIPGLVEALQSKNEDFRLNAAITLGKIGKQAVPPLAELLTSTDEDTRYYAVWALGWIGPDASDTAGKVVKLLADKNDGVRRKAAFTLGRIAPGAKLAVPVLIEAFGDKNEDVQAAAVEAVAKFGSDAVPALIDVLKGKDTSRAQQAAKALGEIGSEAKDAIPVLQSWLRGTDKASVHVAGETLAKIGKASIPVLIEATKDQNAGTRITAVDALHKVGADAATDLVDALGSKYADVRRQAAMHLAEMRINDKMVVLGLAYALKDEDETVRFHSAHGLQMLGNMAKLAAPKLKEALIDINFNVRQMAWQALQGMGENPQPILKKHLADKNAVVRIPAAALLLVMYNDQDALPILREALKEKDNNLKMQAAFTLAQRGQGSKETTEVFIEGLKSKSVGVRQQAIQGLQQSGSAGGPAAPLLLDILQNDPDPNLRQQALYALQQVGGDAKVMMPALKKMIEDDNANVRMAALQVIWRYGVESIPLIVKCFEDKDDNIRQNAVWILQNVQGDLKSALPQIKMLLKNKNSNVRQGAVHLLARCGEDGAMELVNVLRDKESDDNMRWTAVNALQNLQGQNKKILPILTDMLKKENESKVRMFAVYAMTRIGTDALPILKDLIKNDKDAGVRSAAIQTLGNYGFQYSKEVMPELIAALKDKEPQVRSSACHAFQQMGQNGKQAIPNLAETLKDSDANVRQNAFYALCNMAPESLPAMVSHLKVADSSTRQTTLYYCAQHNYRMKDLVPGLIACLKDGNFNVRLQACNTLAQFGKDGADAVDALKELLQSENNAQVRTAAQTALNAIQPPAKK